MVSSSTYPITSASNCLFPISLHAESLTSFAETTHVIWNKCSPGGTPVSVSDIMDFKPVTASVNLATGLLLLSFHHSDNYETEGSVGQHSDYKPILEHEQ
jgi:hypothetical protein